ncbi:MAG: hypothetical protein H0W12_10340 [Chitinophagaceae bacterium]|nr:hypothetical protein [Chitinophagaceae bacterium]
MIKTKKHFWLKKLSLVILCIFYTGAGINHFWHPASYLDLIPPYFPAKMLINIISGICEISFALLMLFPLTRKAGAILIIALLTAFILAHVYMIQMHGCVSVRLCVPEWVAWLRLFPLQFVLMWWAWKTYQWNKT